MRPVISDLINFDREIDVSKRIDDALVFTHGNTLVLTSIQNVNRTMSGLQHFKYTHSAKIKNFSGICLDGSIQHQALPEEERPDFYPHPETCVIFQDSTGKFGIYDNGHQFCCTLFSYPNMNEVVAFAGSMNPEKPNELALLHKGSLRIIKIKLNAYEELNRYDEIVIGEHKLPITASNIAAFGNGYLIQQQESLFYFENGEFKEYYRTTSKMCPTIADFKVDKDRVVVVSVTGEKCIMTVVGSKTIGLLKWKSGYWDFHDNWITVLLKGELLALINLEDPDIRQIVNLGDFGDKMINVISGADRYGEKYTVSLLKRAGIAFMTIPYKLLTGQASLEPGPESSKASVPLSGKTKVKVPRN